jgi:heptaprenyl diphosphate synthase
MKLGLTNLVVMMALYKMSAKDAIALNFVRIVLVSLTFGNAFSLIYSLAGGMLSCLVMILLKKSGRFGMLGVSVAGGVFHNIGQILVAMVLLETWQIASYVVVLWVSGVAAGVVIGILSGEIVRRLPDDILKGDRR